MEENEVNLKLKNQEDKFTLMFQQNTNDHDTLRKGISRIEHKLDTMIDELDKRYAPMYVKSIVTWLGAAVGSFLVILVLSKIFIK